MNAPWGLDSRLKLVESASDFFHIRNVNAHYRVIGKAPVPGPRVHPLTVADFLKYLEVKSAFPKTPNAFLVAQIIRLMESAGILIRAGRGESMIPALDDQYVHMTTEKDVQRIPFRWVPVLGPEHMYRICAAGLVHITGTNSQSQEVAGTGLVVGPCHVLTCRHVVSDMRVSPGQVFQGRKYAVTQGSIHRHPKVDVAVMRVDGPPLSLLKGAFWRAPVVAQTVYTLGYPKLPGLRDASVTMQKGAVTNESVTSLAGERLFLYSAISRPGNSGGPVMSDDGYVVGLSIVDIAGRYFANEAFSPHYAGIPAQAVIEAVEDLGLAVDLPFEHHE